MSQILELMEQNDEFETNQIKVEICGNCVTLSGEVDSPGTKKLACEMVGKIRGVQEVIDQLEITREDGPVSYPLSQKAQQEARNTDLS